MPTILISSTYSEGLSTAWHANRSPRAAKKSLPKKGKPGRLARTSVRKSGCISTYLEAWKSIGVVNQFKMPKPLVTDCKTSTKVNKAKRFAQTTVFRCCRCFSLRLLIFFCEQSEMVIREEKKTTVLFCYCFSLRKAVKIKGFQKFDLKF